MEDEQRPEPVLKHCILTWDIVNFLMTMTTESYSVESPVFSFANCYWSLTFFAQHVRDVKDGYCLRVSICRKCEEIFHHCLDEIRTTVSIALKTPEQVIAMGEVKNSFARGEFSDVISHSTTWQSVYAELEHLTEDKLAIVCDAIAVTGYYDNNLNDAERILSFDILRLLDTDGNSHLLTRDGRMLPVHKEILSAYSPLFEKQFEHLDCLPISYQQDVVLMMLRFVYSGHMEQAIGDDLPSPELYECAWEYQIFDLQRVLDPEYTYASTVINCWPDVVEISFPTFVESMSVNQREANHPLSRVFLKLKDFSVYQNNIKGRLSAIFDHERGKVCFEMQLWHEMVNNTAPRAIGVCVDYRIISSLESVGYRMRTMSGFDDQGTSELVFEMNVEQLFAEDYVVFPKDILDMVCFFKLWLGDGLDSWGCDSNDPFTTPPANERMTFSLDTNLGYLLESQIMADLTLTIDGNGSFRLPVHRSVITARCPSLFNDQPAGTDTITLNKYFSEKAVEALAFYIYTGHFGSGNFHDYAALILLYMLADSFQIPGLREDCSRTIILHPLTHRNVLKKYRFAFVKEDDNLTECCREYMLRNADMILGTSEWEEFKHGYSVTWDNFTVH